MPQDQGFYETLGIQPGLIDDRQDFVRDAATLDPDKLGDYTLYHDYYDGEQRTQLLARAKEYLEASGLRYCENACEAVVDWPADRMSIESFEVVENEAASEWVNDTLWPRNRGDALQGVVHVETFKLGDGFVIVDWNHAKGMPRLSWNPPTTVKPVYDNGVLVYATKVWTTRAVALTNPDGRQIRRANIYFPDRIEKWFTYASDDGDGTLWAPHVDFPQQGEPPVWPEWNTDTGEEGGDPLGILAVHFRNKPQGRTFGRSELRGVIPQQDALNKQLLDLFYVMDGQGWKQRWATGVPEGTSVDVAIGEFLTSTGENTKFGEFAAEDPRPMLEAIASQYRRMASSSRTPLYLMDLSGTPPTGESLKSAEQPGVKKVRNRMVTVGNAWEDVVALSLRLQQTYGEADFTYDPDLDLVECVWDSPESRDEKAEAEKYEAYHRLGVSKRTILRELGYDPDREADQRKEEAESIGSAILTAFDAGNPATEAA